MYKPWHVQTTPRSPVSLRSKLPPIEINNAIRVYQKDKKQAYFQSNESIRNLLKPKQETRRKLLEAEALLSPGIFWKAVI